MRANSSGVHCVSPALFCSLADSAVSAWLTMALPASSGWARISASWASGPAACSTWTMAYLSAARETKGRFAMASSAIQGECS